MEEKTTRYELTFGKEDNNNTGEEEKNELEEEEDNCLNSCRLQLEGG